MKNIPEIGSKIWIAHSNKCDIDITFFDEINDTNTYSNGFLQVANVTFRKMDGERYDVMLDTGEVWIMEDLLIFDNKHDANKFCEEKNRSKVDGLIKILRENGISIGDN